MIRREAREWLPSRFRLAAFKLIGYVVSKSLPRRMSAEEPVAILTYHAGQHPFEAFFLATSLLILSCAFAADALITAFSPPFWAKLLLVVIAPMGAWIGWVTLLPLVWLAIALGRRAGIVKSSRNVEWQTTLQHIVLLAISVIVVVEKSWSAAVALIWLLFAVTNLLSAILVRALRKRIESLEKELAENPCVV